MDDERPWVLGNIPGGFDRVRLSLPLHGITDDYPCEPNTPSRVTAEVPVETLLRLHGALSDLRADTIAVGCDLEFACDDDVPPGNMEGERLTACRTGVFLQACERYMVIPMETPCVRWGDLRASVRMNEFGDIVGDS